MRIRSMFGLILAFGIAPEVRVAIEGLAEVAGRSPRGQRDRGAEAGRWTLSLRSKARPVPAAHPIETRSTPSLCASWSDFLRRDGQKGQVHQTAFWQSTARSRKVDCQHVI